MADWEFTCSQLPENTRYLATVGNGHIATAVYRDRLFVNGLYNGKTTKSHRAMVPSMVSFQLEENSGIKEQTWTLNCREGTFIHHQSYDCYEAEHCIYIHRTLPIMVNTVTITRKDSTHKEKITLKLSKRAKLESGDLKLSKISIEGTPGNLVKGTVKEPEYEEGVVHKEVYFQYDDISDSLTLPEELSTVKSCFIMSVCFTSDECQKQFQEAKTLFKKELLYQSHAAAWSKIWDQGSIEVKGNPAISRCVYGSLYYLYSSLPTPHEDPAWAGPFFGLTPESLAYGDKSEKDYMGHVFWDQETWMYPPILLLQPDLAMAMLSARTRVIKQCKENAVAQGYKGLKFPWEQGVTGVPTCPLEQYGKYELHINADIALAARDYVYATGCKSNELIDMVHGLSDFWRSRVTWNDKRKSYDLKDVMPPDEFNYPVNNSAYTNMAVQLTLDYSNELKGVVTASEEKMFIPFDDKLQYHPEYEGYTPATKVKQADVVLISYPLNAEPNKEIRRNDLDIYEKVTTLDGPAMTWGIFCINHLQLGEMDQAEKLFNRQLKNVQEPFQIWSELPTGDGAINFITGMGGFLQSVLNGYGGVNISKDSMTIDMKFPPKTSSFEIKGLTYMGAKLTVTLLDDKVSILLTSPGDADLYVTAGGETHKLAVGSAYVTSNGPLKLSRDSADGSYCNVM